VSGWEPPAQGWPNYFKVESVAGCNLWCSFCGIHATGWPRNTVVGEMSLPLAKAIALHIRGMRSHPRIDLQIRGEPLMHSDLPGLIRTFRYFIPRASLMVATNGLLLTRDLGVALFKAGLTTLLVELYRPIREQVRALNLPAEEHDYPGDFSPWLYHTGRHIVYMPSIGEGSAGGLAQTRRLTNHAGNAVKGSGPLAAPLDSPCAHPFRELSIFYDGLVPLCCNDWREQAIIGRFPDDGALATIWRSACYSHARAFLRVGKRASLAPCDVCDVKTTRNGLLPRASTPDALALATCGLAAKEV